MSVDDEAAYLAAVESRFVALRGKGYMLSARDVARVEAWRARGVPLGVALRVIEQGVRDYRRTWRVAGGPRGLGYFELAIDEAMRARAGRLLGGAHGPGSAEGDASGDEATRTARTFARLLDALESAGRAQPDGPVRDALRHAWQRVRAAAVVGGDAWALTAEVDTEIVDAVAASLPLDVRHALEREARGAVGASGGARMSGEAREELERFEIDARLREYAGVPELVEVLLDPSM